MAMVVGRRVLGAYVSALSSGLDVPTLPDEAGDNAKWSELGKTAFTSEAGEDVRRAAIEGVLDSDPSGWCEEQTTALRHAYACILTRDEDWLGAARALMNIPLDGGSRYVAATSILKGRGADEAGWSPTMKSWPFT